MPDGSIVDAKTRNIVGTTKEEEQYRPPATVEQPTPTVMYEERLVITPKSLAEQIKEAEAHLDRLKLQKIEEIVKKRKELEELEKL